MTNYCSVFPGYIITSYYITLIIKAKVCVCLFRVPLRRKYRTNLAEVWNGYGLYQGLQHRLFLIQGLVKKIKNAVNTLVLNNVREKSYSYDRVGILVNLVFKS